MAPVARAWNFDIDFIGRMRPILWGSVALTLLSVAAICGRGLNFGTDFAGGYEIQASFPGPVSESQIRDVLAPMGLDDARVQSFGDPADNAYLILVPAGTASLKPAARQALRAAMVALAGDAAQLTAYALAEGGERLTVGFGHAVEEAALRAALAAEHLEVTGISRGERADRPEYTVTLASLADTIAATLRAGLHVAAEHELIARVDFVGPQVGAQLRNQGILAVVYSLGLILLYVALRFDLFFSPGAVIATLHDVIVTVGVFAALQIEFNLNVVAAILTLIGYSLNDTIVVYDRIRENVARLRGRPLRPLVNDSINETLSRTILTSGTVFMVVTALLVLGGPFIRGFAITMFVGVIIGTYSSIAVASPLYVLLREHYAPAPASGPGKLRGSARMRAS